MSHSLCISDFQALSYNLLNTLTEMIDRVDIDGVLECENCDGVVKISDSNGNLYIINKHEPSMQIWVASPISGSVRFSYDKSLSAWINDKSDELFNFLRVEMKVLFDIVI
ncbi:iron donor protein CyaY [Ehrlichia canis]|uniref:CyaY protein n=1 Tax=Ehrlichia canis (strain Jake) TaxID=269484 RepID=A0ACA6AW67_EHRCJ|nr:iron donor protein CyaY [Ehrlichia canis]AAZ68723.1 CyaY protein [Ehrlichia canis str. Jake]AUO54547.1 iron donor protein CyaY [Ehrlichia canis]UKC53792.1 cyaY [Ehrlichia canis]UKC54729.1 cyaY [Ehrlichia canis]UKC55665.1 cyaY [Ehrlichia canis]